MQRSKNIQNLSEIDQYTSGESDFILSTFKRILGRFNLNGINRVLKPIKCKGIDVRHIFQVLFLMPFINLKNVHSLMQSGVSSEVNGSKDTYYRFMKDPNIPWRKILIAFSKQFQKIVKENSEDEDRSITPRCLIVDDTVLDKAGLKIEMIGKVFDHCSHRFSLGIKLLLAGLWDGKNFIPLDFSLHNEPGKKQNRGLSSAQVKQQFSKNRHEDCPSYQRVEEVKQSKITIAIEMIERFVTQGFRFEYVLADSWFISEGFIKSILDIKRRRGMSIDLIGLMKSNRYVQINGKAYLLSKLPELKRAKIKFCKKLGCFYIPIKVRYKGIDLKIFLIRMKGQETWKVLISTNQSLSFVNAMRIYQIRWSIEVFFKDAKQNLTLGKCQSIDLDAHIATISMACMNYTTLALAKRFEAYETIGHLFRKIKDQIIQENIVQKIWRLMKEIYIKILADFGMSWEFFLCQLVASCDFINKIRNICNIILNFEESKLDWCSQTNCET